MAARVAVLVLGVASFLVAYTSATAVIRFGYKGSIGPDKWGSLSPEYHLCSDGKRQSPINIVKDDVVYNPELQSLKRNYVPKTNATLVDNGFNIGVKYDEHVGTMLVNGKNYSLLQMHWHSPSEHTINGVRYAMELHLVHRSDDGNLTVVAILFQYGHPDPFLLQIKDKVTELAKEVHAGDEAAKIPLGVVDTKFMRRATRKYFRYVGSLTTPPCTENVIWNVLGKVREMSKEQAAALRAPLDVEYHYNARPPQALNGRKVELYDELWHNSRR